MDTEHFMALQAVHGAVHAARIGLKYTWFGPGYISNVYFKMIAGTPTYLPFQNEYLSFGNHFQAYAHFPFLIWIL